MHVGMLLKGSKMRKSRSKEYRKSCHKGTPEISLKEEKVETKVTQNLEKKTDQAVREIEK